MILRKSRTMLSHALCKAKARLAACAASVVLVAAGSPPTFADTPPAARAAVAAQQATKAQTKVAEPGQTRKPAAAKAKPRTRTLPKTAKPAATPAAKSPSAPTDKAGVDSSAKPRQVMDFDTDQVEGQRLEPGYELIEAPLRRARHPSLVPTSPKPQDSVVNKP